MSNFISDIKPIKVKVEYLDSNGDEKQYIGSMLATNAVIENGVASNVALIMEQGTGVLHTVEIYEFSPTKITVV